MIGSRGAPHPQDPSTRWGQGQKAVASVQAGLESCFTVGPGAGHFVLSCVRVTAQKLVLFPLFLPPALDPKMKESQSPHAGDAVRMEQDNAWNIHHLTVCLHLPHPPLDP